jgi:hypothetical protein
MSKNYRESLHLLEGKLKFRVDEITATDLFYNDGDQRVLQSFFKLVLTREDSSVAVVFICETTYWVSFGSLTAAERTTLDEWMKNISS